MHPYKMMLAQELSKRDTETHRALCLEIQQHVPYAAVVLFRDEVHFHLCGTVKGKTSDTGQRTTLMSCMKALCIVLGWLYGVQWQNLVYRVHTSLKTTLQ